MTENINTTEIILITSENEMECFRVVMNVRTDTPATESLLTSLDVAWEHRKTIFCSSDIRYFEMRVALTDAEILAVSDAFAAASQRAEDGYCPWALWKYDIALLADIWWSAVTHAECDDDTWNSLTGEA